MTAPDPQRWDPSTPRFVIAVLRVEFALLVAASVAGVLWARAMVWSIMAGGVFALALLGTAMQAGRIFARTRRYAPTMTWLVLQQCVLWIGLALLVVVLRVNAVGFALGVSILPIGIILTLIWFVLKAKGLPS